MIPIETLVQAIDKLSQYISNMDSYRTDSIRQLTLLAQAVSELKIRRNNKVKVINENTSSPGVS